MSESTKKEKSKTKVVFGNILFVIYVLFMLVTISTTSFIWYQKFYFKSYWVDGQSMWPTLNAFARDSSGNLYNEKKGSVFGATDIDYVIGDLSDSVIDKAKRFDIIVCKYSDDDTRVKIKRVIALPGETFFIDSTGIGKEGNGTLHILNQDTKKYEIVEQPIDQKIIEGGDYLTTFTDLSKPYTLKSDEYFVMGDNRANSTDSRSAGPIKRRNIESKIIALVGRCSIGGTITDLQAEHINYFWPEFYK